MRELTLHEKISLKGILQPRLHNCGIPRLTMGDALHYWSQMFGYTKHISRWYLQKYS